MKEKEFYPVHHDLMFKNLFGTSKNIRFTADLLEAIFDLEEGSLINLEILNSITLDKETIKTRKFELDVKVKLPNGDLIDLEMQNKYDENAEIKNFMYVTGMFYSQLKTGEAFEKTKEVTGINFIKSTDLHNKDKIIQKYCMINEDDINDKILANLFNVLIINVEHNCEIFYNENISRFESWRRFIGANTLEELESIAENRPILKSALEECKRFMEFDFEEDGSVQEKLIRSQGYSEGKEESKINIAKKLLQENIIPIEKLAEITELSLEELEKIKNEINYQ